MATVEKSQPKMRVTLPAEEIDQPAYMKRINALREQYHNTRVDMDVYNAKYLTEGFKETEGQPWIIQKATGFRHQCEKKNIYRGCTR